MQPAVEETQDQEQVEAKALAAVPSGPTSPGEGPRQDEISNIYEAVLLPRPWHVVPNLKASTQHLPEEHGDSQARLRTL